ncbi:MAG TPA: ABC-2 family transporter protein [Chloroflexota bacterium]|nr:ABC-2 family transporter protein [Chloroflexota bacterium]
MLDFYLVSMRMAIATQIQYRLGNYLWMLGMVAEPIIYLVVWQTIAKSSGGSVGGYTAGQLAAYYIVWTLVRNVNIVFTPYGWEPRIRQGQFSALLLRPLHPIHYDLSFFAGWKVVVVAFWLPLAVVLTLIFHPVVSLSVAGMASFVPALMGAYLIRSLFLWALGMVTIWTTKVGGLFELYISAELILSGRLVPTTLLPGWVRAVSAFLPFQWTFGFPINALIGKLSTGQLLTGLGMQALWIALGAAIVAAFWGVSIRHYSAVGN